MGLMWLLMMAFICYLVGRVAYVAGRTDKWNEMCSDYICIHKSTLIRPLEAKKELDKCRKNKYNKKAYKKQKHIDNVKQ